MADTINIELLTYDDIRDQYPFWNQWKITEDLIKRGKEPQIYHVDLVIDTSTANTATESTAPTNEVLNFSAPQQVYIRSDNAADQSLTIDVIGQKADGSFGQFTLTSNASNGTTAVDVGTWNFISFPIKNDAFAGNVIIDDDGASGTVFWTLALGVSGVDGILMVPTGYRACLVTGVGSLTAAPASAPVVMGLDIADSWKDLLTTSVGVSEPKSYSHYLEAEDRLEPKHFYRTSVTTTTIDFYVVLWEV